MAHLVNQCAIREIGERTPSPTTGASPANGKWDNRRKMSDAGQTLRAKLDKGRLDKGKLNGRHVSMKRAACVGQVSRG